MKWLIGIGIVVLLVFGMAQYRGWAFTSYSSYRGDPGVMRSDPIFFFAGYSRGLYPGGVHK